MSASPPAAAAAVQGGGAAQRDMAVSGGQGARQSLSRSSGFVSLGDVRYVAAPGFTVSSLQSEGKPLPHVSMIRVPPFVAAAWRASKPHELLGVLYGENERQRILCRSSIKSHGTTSPSSSSFSSNDAASTRNFVESHDSTATAAVQQRRRTEHQRGRRREDIAIMKKEAIMPDAPAPTCELQCASIKKNNHLLLLQQQALTKRQSPKGEEEDASEGNPSSHSSDSSSISTSSTAKTEADAAAASSRPAAADVLCAVEETYNFAPRLDQKYHKFLRQRHECVNVYKTRTTIEEKRREAGLDSTATLFHFFQPPKPAAFEEDRGEHGASALMTYNPRSGAISAERARFLKQKKALVTMDEDSLKVKLFQAFERAGAAGLQLKQIVQYTQQPLSFLRAVVEEIAEPRKRASDRKTVYLLKDQYNPYPGNPPFTCSNGDIFVCSTP